MSDQSEKTGTGAVLKFTLPALLQEQANPGIGGEFPWPIAPKTLALLYRHSPEHGRAIHIKAECSYGLGMEGAGVEKLDALCEAGATNLFKALGIDLETFGNAFMQIIRRPRDKQIIGLRRLPAITMHRFRKGFLQRTRSHEGREKKVTFRGDEIVHLREPCPMGRPYAYPTWIGAEGMLELAHAATRYNAAFFKNNAMPEFAVIFKGTTPTEAQKRTITEFFRNEYRGFDNAHRTLLLSAGEDGDITFERITAEMKDADFLKLLDAARDRIPIAHAVPPRMMGIMSAGQLGGGGEVTGQLFTFEHLTCQPRRDSVLDQARPVLKELGLRPGKLKNGLRDDEIAFTPLDLTPPKDDAENLPQLVQAGILTPEEARAILPVQEASGQAVERSAASPLLSRLVRLLEQS